MKYAGFFNNFCFVTHTYTHMRVCKQILLTHTFFLTLTHKHTHTPECIPCSSEYFNNK